MLEEKNGVELKDDDLKEVGGGHSKILFGEVYDGDCKKAAPISGGYCINSIFCESCNCKYHS